MILAGPGIPAGKTVDYPVVSMDVFATAEELADLPVTAMDGVSLLHIIEGDVAEEREMFWHYPHYHGSAWKPGSAIRVGDWKLIFTYEDQKVSLFDLSKDEGETLDLATSNPAKATELLHKLHDSVAATNGQYPVWKEDDGVESLGIP